MSGDSKFNNPNNQRATPSGPSEKPAFQQDFNKLLYMRACSMY